MNRQLKHLTVNIGAFKLHVYTHTHSEQEFGEVIALVGPYQRHVTAQNTHETESTRGVKRQKCK